MQEGACREQSERTVLRFEDLPFSRVPGQSKLFLQYLSDPVSLQKYFPSTVSNIGELSSRKDEVLASHLVDREAMCEVLMDQNAAFGGGRASAENVLKLKDAASVAVLTGQQAGLFTGPLYTIYKALSAIRISEELNARGVKSVPVFWIATQDHDFEEVSNAWAIGHDGKLVETRFSVPEPERGKPVGKIAFDSSIESLISDWLGSMASSVSSPEIVKLLSDSYSAGSSFGLAFGKTLAKLFERYGLVIFDPLDDRVQRLAGPIVSGAIERSEEVVAALRTRSSDLQADGYHAQVLIGENYFPLFWHSDDGRRSSIKRTDSGKYRVSGSKSEFTAGKLSAVARSEPERFSAGVMLRPIVQDFLFPTICYVGGGAEIAYFAQNSEAYRILKRPATPIFHRQSFTVVEPKHSRTSEKYKLIFEDVFRGFDALLPEIIERLIDPDTSRVFADVEEKINTELNRLDQQLSQIDPTLSANLATRRRKIIYHIGALRTKFERARIQKDETANRRLRSLFVTLYPENVLQERMLNFAHFANLYGVNFIEWIHDSIDVNNKDHRILYIR